MSGVGERLGARGPIFSLLLSLNKELELGLDLIRRI